MYKSLPLLILIYLVSCTQRGTGVDNIGNVSEYALNAKIISTITPETALLPENLVLCNNELFVTCNEFSDNVITTYDLNGHKTQSGVRYGQGPDELLEVTSLHGIGGVPYIYDSRNGSIYQINTQDEIQIVPVIKNIRMHDDALSIPPYVLIARTASDNSYCLLDLKGAVCDSLSYFPMAPKGIDPFTHSLACTGYLALHNESCTFIRALAYDGGIDFFTIKAGKILHQKRFEIFPMEYSVINHMNQNIPVPSKKSISGFIHVAVSNNNFYASFSESKSLDNPEGIANKIYRFDLMGNLVSIYNLDKGITSFDVTPTDSAFYALSPSSSSDDTQIVSFAIQ